MCSDDLKGGVKWRELSAADSWKRENDHKMFFRICFCFSTIRCQSEDYFAPSVSRDSAVTFSPDAHCIEEKKTTAWSPDSFRTS